jgi:hypothetical protein
MAARVCMDVCMHNVVNGTTRYDDWHLRGPVRDGRLLTAADAAVEVGVSQPISRLYIFVDEKPTVAYVELTIADGRLNCRFEVSHSTSLSRKTTTCSTLARNNTISTGCTRIQSY